MRNTTSHALQYCLSRFLTPNTVVTGVMETAGNGHVIVSANLIMCTISCCTHLLLSHPWVDSASATKLPISWPKLPKCKKIVQYLLSNSPASIISCLSFVSCYSGLTRTTQTKYGIRWSFTLSKCVFSLAARRSPLVRIVWTRRC